MGWVAKKKMKIQRGDSLTTVFAGDPVPEAENWRTRNALERQNFIEWVNDDVPTPPVEDRDISKSEPKENTVSIKTKIIPKKETKKKTTKKKTTKKKAKG